LRDINDKTFARTRNTIVDARMCKCDINAHPQQEIKEPGLADQSLGRKKARMIGPKFLEAPCHGKKRRNRALTSSRDEGQESKIT